MFHKKILIKNTISLSFCFKELHNSMSLAVSLKSFVKMTSNFWVKIVNATNFDYTVHCHGNRNIDIHACTEQ